MATLQSLGSVAGLINLDYGKFKYAVDQMRTSADGINGNVEERARGAERSEALDEFAEQFVQLQRIISLYKSLIKKDIDAIETTGEQLKEIDLKLEGVWKGLQMLKYEYMERKRMETEQKEMMCKYKKIICKIFGEQIRVIGESSAIGPMGQFQIRFFYEPTKIYVTLDADRGAFTFDLKDEAKDWNTLYRIKKFDNCMTEKCLENAAVILKQVLEENKFPLYKSENDKLYKKQDGTYRRIKDIYAELAGGE